MNEVSKKFDPNKWLVVIPARLDSTRLPQKPLINIQGLPLIVKTYKNLEPLLLLGFKTIVATDSEKIADLCLTHNIPVKISKIAHNSGTERVNEIAQVNNKNYILNVQGDEPFLNTKDILKLCESFEKNQLADIATLVFNSNSSTDFSNPNIVKAIKSNSNKALYFSRSSIPFFRPPIESIEFSFWQHLGVYAYKKSSLDLFCRTPPSKLELSEKLEQLRAIENDMYIHLVEAKFASRGIDTPEDLEGLC